MIIYRKLSTEKAALRILQGNTAFEVRFKGKYEDIGTFMHNSDFFGVNHYIRIASYHGTA